MNLLNAAIRNARVPLVAELLTRFPELDVNTKNKLGTPAFFMAVIPRTTVYNAEGDQWHENPYSTAPERTENTGRSGSKGEAPSTESARSFSSTNEAAATDMFKLMIFHGANMEITSENISQWLCHSLVLNPNERWLISEYMRWTNQLLMMQHCLSRTYSTIAASNV